jgi:hypothetical protein
MARRPCPSHDISQILEMRSGSCLLSLIRCLVLFRVPASKAKSPVAGLFAGHLALSRTRSAIGSHLRTRTVVLRYAVRIMRPRKRCGRSAQRERSSQSEGAQISHDTCLHGRSPFKCVCEGERAWCGSAAAPSRGSAVSQILLAIARHLPVMMRAGSSGNTGQCGHRQSKRQYDLGRHVHLRFPSWPRNRWRTPRGANAGTSFPLQIVSKARTV